MSTNNKQTGMTAASAASKLLRDPATSAAVRKLAASELAKARYQSPPKKKTAK